MAVPCLGKKSSVSSEHGINREGQKNQLRDVIRGTEQGLHRGNSLRLFQVQRALVSTIAGSWLSKRQRTGSHVTERHLRTSCFKAFT